MRKDFSFIIITFVYISCINSSTAHTKDLHIFWNSSNAQFADSEQILDVRIKDRLNLHCAYYPDRRIVSNDRVEMSIIYMVSEFGYKNCMLDQLAKPVGQCRSPWKANTITLVLREFTPMPGGLEFMPGFSYYFISTSDGTPTGLTNRRGGLCSSRNLRMRLDVKAAPPAVTKERFLDELLESKLSPPPSDADQRAIRFANDATKHWSISTEYELVQPTKEDVASAADDVAILSDPSDLNVHPRRKLPRPQQQKSRSNPYILYEIEEVTNDDDIEISIHRMSSASTTNRFADVRTSLVGLCVLFVLYLR